MKIDIFSHILPEKYFAALKKKAPKGTEFPESNTRAVWDKDVRLRLMDRYPDVMQVLTLSLPPVDTLTKPADAIELSKTANDELAELVEIYPDKFVAAAACLPLNDMDASLEELERAITGLGLKGVQLFTNINGEPLYHPKFRPIFQKMAEYDLPVWIHPMTDRTKLEPVFGWPYSTTQTMVGIVTAGIFTDFPDIKIITHHCGGMIPFFSKRLYWMFSHGPGRENNRGSVGQFTNFYGDTALYGDTEGLMCGYKYFGADNLLFGTDAPLGPSPGLIFETLDSVDKMDITDIEKEKIFFRNAVEILAIAL